MGTPPDTQVGAGPSVQSNGRGHAIVIGGSITGMLAARVLADHFERVTVIERDQVPDEPGFRKGVPQSRHIHLLLLRGKQILEQLFPGLVSDLIMAGAPEVDFVADAKRFSPAAGWGPRFPSKFALAPCSRELLEWAIRRHLVANPTITYRAGYEVRELIASADRSSVVGVQMHARTPDAAPQPATALYADLVVDASGRDSRTPRWLESMGYVAPATTKVNSFLGYASRYYDIPQEVRADWKILWVLSNPPATTRTGGILPVERNRWMVSMFGAAHDYPPTDEAGFLEFARGLAHPAIYDVLRRSTSLSPIYGYRRTENVLHHYERLPRQPERLIVIGDAVSAFNPFYAQGMTIMAIAAQLLDRCLHEQRRQANGELTGFAQRFQRALAKSNATPWMLATGADFLYPTTEGGQRSWLMRLMQGYVDQAWAVGASEPQVYTAFLDVMNLLQSPAALFRPAVLTAVLKHKLRPTPAPIDSDIATPPEASVGQRERSVGDQLDR